MGHTPGPKKAIEAALPIIEAVANEDEQLEPPYHVGLVRKVALQLRTALTDIDNQESIIEELLGVLKMTSEAIWQLAQDAGDNIDFNEDGEAYEAFTRAQAIITKAEKFKAYT